MTSHPVRDLRPMTQVGDCIKDVGRALGSQSPAANSLLYQ